ncbi:MAG: MaoC family dehydratase N-terminal domain-containing protein [Chloroflexi bacterium]|nr:MaoC family dehydratase N-terminal domain-containing protein [Chloroflexota bacterium]
MPMVREITIEKISRYARASGDFNPVHLDESFARRTLFGGIVAHGMLLLGYIGSLMEGAFGGGWREGGGMDVRLRAPARPGDLVEIRSVLQETPTEARGAIAECQVACVNQRGEVLVAGRAWARLT